MPNFVVVYHFKVSFIDANGTVDAAFRDVSGFNAELKTEEFTSGGENGVCYKLPKGVKYGTLKLSRALSGSKEMDEITKWAEAAINDFVISPKTVAVSLLNEEHKPVRTWRFADAYPVKLALGDMDASKNELAIETLELAYKYVKREK